MYVAVDITGNIVAIHQERRVIKKFERDYYKSHGEHFEIYKVKKKIIKKCADYEDLYLVRCGNKYIQTKFYIIEDLDCNQMIEDLYQVYDTIIRVIEFREDKKDCDILGEALVIIDDEIDKYKTYIPTVKECETRLDEINEYLNKTQGG